MSGDDEDYSRLEDLLEEIERDHPDWTEQEVDSAWMEAVEKDEELRELAISHVALRTDTI